MCCESCESCENWKFVSFFFGAWNIICGILIFIYSTIDNVRSESPIQEGGHINAKRIFLWVVLFTAIIHILSGALILTGLWMDKKLYFLVGLILSNIMPLATFFTIIIPVVHIICLLKAIRYYRWNWE